MTKIQSCRLCESTNLSESVFFQNQFLNDFVERGNVRNRLRVPIELVQCCDCSLVQQSYTAPADQLYRTYWYRSGVTNTMQNQLREIVSAAESEITAESGDVFLDIGANDGTMLSFVSDRYVRVGVDPAENLRGSLEENSDVAITDYWGPHILDQLIKLGHSKPKVITAIGMFYDLEKPVEFVQAISDSLAESGVFISQLMTLEPMLDTNDLGNLCHEHIEFYTYESLVYLFETCGLEIYKVEENPTNGGSYRIFSRHLKSGSINYGRSVSIGDVKAFKARLDLIKADLRESLEKIKARGLEVHGLGASTKGNTILQYLEIGPDDLQCISERSPEKYDLFTVGTGIPILSEADSRSLNPDYYLILPWAFTAEIMEREKEFLLRGGGIIHLFPEFRVDGLDVAI